MKKILIKVLAVGGLTVSSVSAFAGGACCVAGAICCGLGLPCCL